MSVVTYCRTLDGTDPELHNVPKREGDEGFCNEAVMCRCGAGPVACSRGADHEGEHAAYGMKSLLVTWTNA